MDTRQTYKWNGQGSDHGPESGQDRRGPDLRTLLLRVGLWVSICLLVASPLPGELLAPALKSLLIVSAFVVSAAALLRGEAPLAPVMTGHDVAAVLLLLGMAAGLFVDQAAVEAFLQSAGMEQLQGANGPQGGGLQGVPPASGPAPGAPTPSAPL